MRIEPLGDSACLVRIAGDFDPERSLDAVLRGLQQLEAAAIPGVIEFAPSYATIGVFFDPSRIEDFDRLKARIEIALQADAEASRKYEPRELQVPVCYDEEFALDLDAVTKQTNLPPEEVVRRHAEAIYRVACVGFTPGFPYLSGLPAELATPRRASPRTEIPAGSIAIGGAQTGIYPGKSPGGWNIIGRTPLRLFDVERDPPALLRAGDRVSFRKISRQEFDAFRP
ncbi:MAG TPA: 5-oxoprolinase subunit PxpB [Chthoniobacterales bacterium]|nr:5-oxoprolinase subunit PxpB [Chthoniobacterales bacterium]